jgi:hypothetical protein
MIIRLKFPPLRKAHEVRMASQMRLKLWCKGSSISWFTIITRLNWSLFGHNRLPTLIHGQNPTGGESRINRTVDPQSLDWSDSSLHHRSAMITLLGPGNILPGLIRRIVISILSMRPTSLPCIVFVLTSVSADRKLLLFPLVCNVMRPRLCLGQALPCAKMNH